MNLNKLAGKVAESGKRKKELAKAFGISVQALNKKLNGKTKISTDDAQKFCSVLEITDIKEKAEIFYSNNPKNGFPEKLERGERMKITLECSKDELAEFIQKMFKKNAPVSNKERDGIREGNSAICCDGIG